MNEDIRKKLSTALVDIIKYATLTIVGVLTGATLTGCAFIPVLDF